MLSVLTSREYRPESEAVDRDPGIVAFTVALVRIVGHGFRAAAARVRSYHQTANEAELFSSSTAWPHRHR